MVNSMVERATSSMLIGPDWAMNTEICDICNHDPAQAKDVVKGIKKRLGSKNPKVQLLALTLLETIMKNCGDFVHMHVAERDLLHEMVKIVKKKPDFHVKEKILILIDTWQEAFGGSRARYPQYYAAYHELLRLGAVFPQRSDRSAPVLTNPQTQSRSSYPNNPENGNEAAESSVEAEFPTLSLTELQNARGIMDVLAEMLTAIDPEKKEGLRQEVIVDLVEQCRTYKQRVVHLVNSTSDESLLCQGLALNDDLQRLLTKHEALVSGASVPSENSKPETSQALVPVDAPFIDTGDSKQPGSTSGTGAGADAELLAIAPITTNGPSTTPAKVNPKFDLLSGDDFSSPTAENSLAIVPIGEPQSTSTASQQNALALVDMLSPNNVPDVPAGQTYSSPPQFQQSQKFPSHQSSLYPNASIPNTVPPQYELQSPYNQGSSSSWNGHMPQQQPLQGPPLPVPQSPYNQGSSSSWNGHIPQQQPLQEPPLPVPQSPYNQGSSSSWNGHMPQQQPLQEPPLPVYGAPTSDGLPPPPWEAQSPDDNQSGSPQYSQPQGLQTMGQTNDQGMSIYMQQPIIGSHLPPLSNQAVYPQQQFQGQQIMGMIPQQQIQPGPMPHTYPQPMAQQMYGNQMTQAYGYGVGGGNYGFGYGYSQQQNAQFLDQRMSGLSVRDDGFLNSTVYTGPSMANASYVHVPSGKPTKPEDKLFGDLVDFAKVKPNKTTPA